MTSPLPSPGPRDASQVVVPPSTRTTRSAIAAIKDDYSAGAIERDSIRPPSGFDFDGDSDIDDETDGLLIPLENGWVCEKRLVNADSPAG